MTNEVAKFRTGARRSSNWTKNDEYEQSRVRFSQCKRLHDKIVQNYKSSIGQQLQQVLCIRRCNKGVRLRCTHTYIHTRTYIHTHTQHSVAHLRRPTVGQRVAAEPVEAHREGHVEARAEAVQQECLLVHSCKQVKVQWNSAVLSSRVSRTLQGKTHTWAWNAGLEGLFKQREEPSRGQILWKTELRLNDTLINNWDYISSSMARYL